MLTSIKHPDIIKALKWCANRKVGLLCRNPKEWIDYMGFDYKSVRHHNLAALNVAQAGRKLNDSMGYDWIGDNFPYFPRQSEYRSHS